KPSGGLFPVAFPCAQGRTRGADADVLTKHRTAQGKRRRRARAAAASLLFVDAAHANVLDLDVLVDAVLRAFAAETGLLDAAERRDLGGDEPGVDADHAVLERLGNPPDAADVTRIEVRRQPELGPVGELDHFGVARKPEQWRDR